MSDQVVAAATAVARAATEESRQLRRSSAIRLELAELITLTFRPLHEESSMLVRGMYFRICADATLRGPDNAIAARYSERLWQLGPRQYRSFECSGPVYLRVTNSDGSRERIGPYDFIKASEGALFAHERCLGLHSPPQDADVPAAMWREVALLSSL